VAELRPHVQALRQAGVEPYVIGSGTPAQARAFAEHVEVAGLLPILSDTKLLSYRAAGMKRSLTATLSPRGILQYVRAFKKFKQGKTQGDPWQLGGVYIIKPSGEVTFTYIGQHGGDHPDPALLVDTARKTTA
jgi:hypothetical protein